MDKSQVARIFEEIGTLLEIQGENPFKCRAYYSGARSLSTLSEDLEVLVRENRLGEIKGLGTALREKVVTLVTQGKLPYYEELRASFPEGLFEVMEIPGLGPKKIKTLYEQLHITSIEQLEKACHEHALADLPGFGSKTEEKILAGIEQLRKYSHQHRYGDIIELAEDLVDTLRTHPDIVRVSLGGSLRRRKETVKDIDILASSKKPRQIMDDFVRLPEIERVISHGFTKTSVLLQGGIQCDLRVVEDAQYACALHHFTGSKEHNVAMRQRALAQGMKLSEWGLFKKGENAEPTGDEEQPLLCRSEEELFVALGLSYVPPELREDLGEIEAAAEGAIPRLVEWTDLRGAFHNHTNASDGAATLEEMARGADALGLEYLGIADHSKSSFQANGLSEERLLDQIALIEKMNRSEKYDVRLLSGVECDVLKDGSLDYADEILEQLDYAVASVHAVFTLSEADMTKRIIRAIENPHIRILGHLTGRLLLKRDPYAVNIPKIIDAAAETGTWIELNASPWRLDMDWRWWKRARDKGVRCVISPDAHSVGQLGHLKPGAEIARKGWLRKQDIINTLRLAQVQELLQSPKTKVTS